MEKENNKESISLFSEDVELPGSDPLEEIFSLNIGDMLTESLISDELAQKINARNTDETENLKKQLKELTAIYSPDKTLSILGLDRKEEYIFFNSIAQAIREICAADVCNIWLEEDAGKSFSLAGSSLKVEFSDVREELKSVSEPNFVKKFTGKLRQIECKKNTDFVPLKTLGSDKTIYCLSVPLESCFSRRGVIFLENHTERQFGKHLTGLVETIAKLFAASTAFQGVTEIADNLIADEKASVYDLRSTRAELTSLIGDLGILQQNFVERLAETVDGRSGYDVNHSKRVARLAGKICSVLELNEKTKDLVYYAALLRNIGKITIPIELFNKKGKLTKEDWKKLYNHPNVGVSFLMCINFMAEVIPYIHYHKERWDGKGPAGLRGEGIPLGSRIIAVADAFCALISKRSYRNAMSVEEALEIIKSESDQKWDPMLVEVLLKLESQEDD